MHVIFTCEDNDFETFSDKFALLSRNIFGSSSAIFGILRNSLKMFGNIRTTFRQHFANLRKSSQNGRQSSENRQKHRN